MDKLAHEVFAAIVAFASALVPAAFGSAVSLAFETGLTWAQRFVQMMVGIVVSYFATGAIAAVWQPNPFMQQAIGFVVGMIAFKAVPRFRDGMIEAVADLPGTLRDSIPFLRRKDRP